VLLLLLPLLLDESTTQGGADIAGGFATALLFGFAGGMLGVSVRAF
jgi:hypothetical protein